MHRSSQLRRILTVILMVCVPLTSFAAEKKPGSTAFLKSLIVPGWGQYSLGGTNTALTFFGAELILVGGMLTLNSYGRSTRDDYEAMAAAYAGVSGSHSHSYYVDVGNWLSVDQYNEQRLRERDFAALYTDPRDRWSWESDQQRGSMENLRIKSDRAFNNILYFAGGLVLNHVASAIHAGRLAVRQQKRLSALSPSGWGMDVAPMVRSKGLKVRFTHAI
jgi:hypothetical protein